MTSSMVPSWMRPKWDIPPDDKRRDAYWMRKAIALDGKGHLVISTLKEGDKYIDGCVRTKGKFERAFGYDVARIELQKQPGHWSAFWLYNQSVNKVGDEGRANRDRHLREALARRPGAADASLGRVREGPEFAGNVMTVPGIMEGWHTFSLLWLPDEYVFYVDGKETWRTKAGGVCQVPLYIKLSDEVGKWGGDIAKATLPDAFLVDYVRVYDLVDKK